MATSNNILTQNDIRHVDYKDVDLLRQFLNPHGRVVSRRKTGLTAKQQRAVEEAVKRARFMGLLPYVQKSERGGRETLFLRVRGSVY
jgi:small subunit ribosomal protein S18